jgi:hypothetical protein
MGQNRNDTSVQRAAKKRTADRARCPQCNRGAALQRCPDRVDGALVGLAIECRWKAKGLCTYAVYEDYTV